MTESKPRRQAAMAFILVTLFIDILGIGIIIPVLPELIKQFVGGETALAGRYVGFIAASYAFMQFFGAPILGSLSDRFGRRPILLIALFGLGVDYLMQGFAPSIGWLLLGRLFAGLLGASFTTANAYIADVSTAENRARNFGLVGVAFGLGFIFGPALGGLLGAINLRLPFFAAAGLALVNWLYGLLVLPESLPAEKRSDFSWRKASPWGSIGNLRAYPVVAGLAVAFVFISLAQRGFENVWILFTGHTFGWDERTNGLTLALVGVTAVLVQGLLIKPVISWLGERRTIIVGMTIGTVAYVCYGLASEGWMLPVIIVFGSLSGIAGPAVQGMIAGAVSPSDQGKVQGALTSLMSLTAIFAPLIFTAGLFSYFTSAKAPFELPGAPFLLAALLLLVAIVILIRLFKRIPASAASAAAPEGAAS